MGGSEPSLKKEVIIDPYKTAISSPLSKYLASQVGKGLPRYEGRMYEPLSEEYESRYKSFLGVDPGEWYDKAVADPTIREFKEEFLPEIREGFAGSLRGSGRFRAEEEGMTELSQGLAQGRAMAEIEIPKAQSEMEMQRAAYKRTGYALEYADWFKSLPEMNPMLDKALQFLSGPSGRDVVTYMDPGKAGKGGMIGAGLGMALAILLAPATAGASLGVYAAAGGALGYGAGTMFD